MPPRIRKPTSSLTSTAPSIYDICSSCLRREFSSTPAARTRLRSLMFTWLRGPGENLRYPLPNATNYLTSYDRSGNLLSRVDPEPKPFPLNPNFISESILSEPLREEIWKRVQVDGKSVRQVSVELGVEMRRVGAVVRLVELEKRMRVEGQPLAMPYARAIHAMVPTTPYSAGEAVTPHESINDLPVHSLTKQQIFYPTSESRAFNRVDAGRVFSGAPRLDDSEDIGQGGRPRDEPWRDTKVEIIGKKGSEIPVLKAADARIPHPEMIAYEQDLRDPAFKGRETEVRKRYAQRFVDDAARQAEKRVKKQAEIEAMKTRIDSPRWQFVVTEKQVATEGTGVDGRRINGLGIRYGVPTYDRKRGQVKIPTKVQV